ncbi:MBL fold metallo-hydrolase [Lysinibacillus cavernae]|uniref:MBL fold metallo-hydrolase n=1 Tax=Lysinibacillus cavernae TaxID=2666135 RepID=UPI0012D918A9|nr:MBL fold metallo-hydrolase [Lysinibacillus cavernae]
MTRAIETDFFILNCLSEGIYAAIAKPGHGAWSNAGFVDLGEELLVFDSFSTPSAGIELRRHAENITEKKVKYLINSHYHGDHVFGNQAFEDTTIISTSLTKKWFIEKNVIGDLKREIEEMEKYLNNLKIKIEKNQEQVIRDSLVNQFNEMSKVLVDLPRLKLVLPTVVFEEKLIIEGSKRKVELHCLGGGHTPSDTFMYLPEEKIAFMGDLVTENLHLPIYNPDEYRSILKQVKEMDIITLVPGHGNVGNREQLNSLERYISVLINSSLQALENNHSIDSFLLEFTIPKEYTEWRGVNGIKDNLTKIYNFYSLANSTNG